MSGAERNCRKEKTEPIRPEKRKLLSPHSSLRPQGSEHAVLCTPRPGPPRKVTPLESGHSNQREREQKGVDKDWD